MNTTIDIKSAVPGQGVGVIATLVIAAASSPGPAGRSQIAGTGNQGLVLNQENGVWLTAKPEVIPALASARELSLNAPHEEETVGACVDP